METTTGMSPPPIAATRWKPSTSEITVKIAKAIHCCCSCVPVGTGSAPFTAIIHTIIATMPSSIKMFRKFLAGSISGLPLIFAESLR